MAHSRRKLCLMINPRLRERNLRLPPGLGRFPPRRTRCSLRPEAHGGTRQLGGSCLRPSACRHRSCRCRCFMISAVPKPSAESKTIRARQRCFRGLFQLATIAASRRRLAAFTFTTALCTSRTLACLQAVRDPQRDSFVSWVSLTHGNLPPLLHRLSNMSGSSQSRRPAIRAIQ